MKFICRDCGIEFRLKKIKRGFFDQCDLCSSDQEEPLKYLGYNDGSLNKSTHISVYKGNSSEVRKKISNQKARVC
jgi:hypothetical protein